VSVVIIVVVLTSIAEIGALYVARNAVGSTL